MTIDLENIEVAAVVHVLRTNDTSSGRGKSLNQRIADKLEQQLQDATIADGHEG